MAEYRAPLEEICFALETVAGLKDWAHYPAFAEASPDLAVAVLEEAGKIAGGIIAPTNRDGDAFGAKLQDAKVTTPPSFKAMHRAYCEGGWPGLSLDPAYGGQGLPFSLGLAAFEMVTSANMAYSLQHLLTAGAIEALAAHGSEAQKAFYLPPLVEGRWSASMNLTEPGAGSDVGALKTRAVAIGDGRYHITGQKIFITWGEHDLTENIIHLVLARLPDAPAGTRGISMFIVPKFLEDGTRNDAYCTGLEHKLGIHASPTCVMSFGDKGGCVGYLLGGENRGMRNMFTMMNHARLGVGLQGVAVAERAYQDAAAYALERVQGPAIEKNGQRSKEASAIVEHGDVRRMLMTMRALSEAARALVYRNAYAIDRAHGCEAENDRQKAQQEADLLIPLSKAFATDIGVEVTSLAIQIYGGMGYIEETGVAQHFRDARIAPIYEGTNGIQAMDLVGRKLNDGQAWRALLTEMSLFCAEPTEDANFKASQSGLLKAVDALRDVSEGLFALGDEGLFEKTVIASPFLRFFATTVAGYLLLVQARSAYDKSKNGDGRVFLRSKMTIAHYYIEQILPPAVALVGAIEAGSNHVMAFQAVDFLRS